MAIRTMIGRLSLSSQNGVAGVLWCFIEEGKNIFEGGLHTLTDGDVLTVFADAARATVAWQGTLTFEFETNRQSYPADCGLLPDRIEKGGQKVCDYWVDRYQGLPTGVAPDIWLDFFLPGRPATLRADILDFDDLDSI